MSWADFWERYGYNSRRGNLLSGLMFELKLLVRSNCQTAYIGGSFITNKEATIVDRQSSCGVSTD